MIRDLGLELQIIFNKGAVTVLPSGINKASGLAALPMLKESADVITEATRGAGVSELMRRISAEDASIVSPQRHGIGLGNSESGERVYIALTRAMS